MVNKYAPCKITYRSNSNKRAIKLIHQQTTTFSNVRETLRNEIVTSFTRQHPLRQPRSQGLCKTPVVGETRLVFRG